MATSDIVNGLFVSILGRPADAATLAVDVAAIDAGMPVPQLAASLAASPEAAAAINAAFQTELAHAADAASIAAGQAYLANGGSLAGDRVFFAASSEGQADIVAAYQSVLGRAPTSAELAIQTYALAGGSLANLRASLASEQTGLQGLYNTVLGRSATAGELAGAENAITGGQSVAAFTSQLANSAEAQSDITSAYRATFGRAPTAAELTIQTYALPNISLVGLKASLASELTGIEQVYGSYRGPPAIAFHDLPATAAELATAEAAITGGQSVAGFINQVTAASVSAATIADLGRTATPAELAAGQAALLRSGNYSTVLGQIAMSAEAQADIGVIYQQVLGRAPTASDLAASQQILALGGSLEAAAYNAPGTGLLTLANGNLALLPATGSTVANANSVAGQLITGSEAVADIVAAYQNALERAPTAVELAGVQSELASGISINQVRAQIDTLAGGPAIVIGNVQITPQSLAGSPTQYVYSTKNNAFIVSANPGLTVLSQPGEVAVTGFDPARDTIQVQTAQSGAIFNNFSSGPAPVPNGATTSSVVSNVAIRTDASETVLGLNATEGAYIALKSVFGLNSGAIQAITTPGSTAAVQAAVVSAYQAVYGRAPSATELASGQAALATSTQTRFRASLASEQTGIQTTYAAVLGRAPTASELTTSEGSIASGLPFTGYGFNGYSFAAQLAASPEAQADIRAIYQSLFGVGPTPLQLAIAQDTLTKGGSLYAAESNAGGRITLASGAVALLPPNGNNGTIENSVVANAINQRPGGTPGFDYKGLGGVKQAAVQSLLFSGIPTPLVAQVASGQTDNNAALPGNPSAPITPQTIFAPITGYTGSEPDGPFFPIQVPPTYIFGLFNTDAIISSVSSLSDILTFNGTGGAALVTGFNPATDVLEYQPSEGASGPITAGSAVIGGALLTPSGSSTVVQLTNGPTITLAGVTLSQLSAPNFQVIASTSTT